MSMPKRSSCRLPDRMRIRIPKYKQWPSKKLKTFQPGPMEALESGRFQGAIMDSYLETHMCEILCMQMQRRLRNTCTCMTPTSFTFRVSMEVTLHSSRSHFTSRIFPLTHFKFGYRDLQISKNNRVR